MYTSSVLLDIKKNFLNLLQAMSENVQVLELSEV
jgi:hypothetical protein